MTVSPNAVASANETTGTLLACDQAVSSASPVRRVPEDRVDAVALEARGEDAADLTAAEDADAGGKRWCAHGAVLLGMTVTGPVRPTRSRSPGCQAGKPMLRLRTRSPSLSSTVTSWSWP